MAREFEIRTMCAEDVGAVIELERECGLNPRSETSLLSGLKTNFAIFLVAVAAESARVLPATVPPTRPVSIDIVGMFSARVVLDELQIENVAVAPAFRGHGIGSGLLKAALALATSKGAIRGVLEVRANNGIAQNLYRKFGFDVVATRRDYYRQPVEDALVMICSLEVVTQLPEERQP